MEDSKLWFYIVLGAIYILSRFLKKKKPQPTQTQQADDYDDYEEYETKQEPQSSAGSIEDILRELAEQSEAKKEIKVEPDPEPEPVKPDPIPERKKEPIETYSREPRPIETYSREARPIPARPEPIESYDDEVEMEGTGHFEIERDKPEYKRSEKFAIKQKGNEMATQIHEILAEEEGLRKAIILKEILDRKY